MKYNGLHGSTEICFKPREHLCRNNVDMAAPCDLIWKWSNRRYWNVGLSRYLSEKMVFIEMKITITEYRSTVSDRIIPPTVAGGDWWRWPHAELHQWKIRSLRRPDFTLSTGDAVHSDSPFLSCPSHNVLPLPGTCLSPPSPLCDGDDIFVGARLIKYQVGGSRGGGPLFAARHSRCWLTQMLIIAVMIMWTDIFIADTILDEVCLGCDSVWM